MSLIAAALKPRSILVATDFSEASEKALRYSLALARFYESKFCLAHVVSSLGLTMAGPGAIAACEETVSREAADLKNSLIQAGAFTGIPHKFVVRQGELWPELREIIRQESADLIVVGTHGRHSIAKLFFGSIAERIFRQADRPVLTLGPHTDSRPWFEASSTRRTFLFATDFGHASLHALPQAIAAANQFGAELAFLSIVPAAPFSTDEAQTDWQADARMRTLQRLAELADDARLDTRPELYAEFKSGQPVSEQILETADKLRADLIIMGLHDSAYAGVISHLDLATTYDVICQASSPVLTVSCFSGYDVGPRPTEVTASSWSEADLIRIHGFGAKW
ncbi:MAG: universal stress protein [Terriglobales bacterium]|jgi:nucleotide-binding universal stress UspA family protein